MKYVETVWEKRNLGVDSCRFDIEDTDGIKDVINRIQECNKEYIEVSVNPGRLEAVWSLEEIGFRFIEAIYELTLKKRDIVVPSMFKRFEKDSSYGEATEEEKKEILEQIRTGKMFLSDKIALNPNFGTKAAGERYYLWMKDHFEGGGICYSARYKGELIGFDAATVKDGNVELLLGGVLPKFSGAGVASVFQVGRLLYFASVDVNEITVRISTNNFANMRANEAMGFRLRDAKYYLLRYDVHK